VVRRLGFRKREFRTFRGQPGPDLNGRPHNFYPRARAGLPDRNWSAFLVHALIGQGSATSTERRKRRAARSEGPQLDDRFAHSAKFGGGPALGRSLERRASCPGGMTPGGRGPGRFGADPRNFSNSRAQKGHNRFGWRLGSRKNVGALGWLLGRRGTGWVKVAEPRVC